MPSRAVQSGNLRRVGCQAVKIGCRIATIAADGERDIARNGEES
jgi:hypothetical protein